MQSTHPIKFSVLEWTSYFLILFLLLFPAILGTEDLLVGEGVDLYGTIWFYWWVGYALKNGLDTSATDMFFYPEGKDIFSHTGNNLLDAYLSIPFQELFGFPQYYSVFLFFILTLNVITFRLLAKSIIGSALGTWVATILWTINPFLIGELSMGRPTQTMFFFAFLAIWAFWRLQETMRMRWALALGFFVALQGWCYWYSGYFLAFVLLGLFATTVSTAKRKFVLRDMIICYGLSVAVCLLLIAPALFSMQENINKGLVPGTGVVMENWWSLPDLKNNIGSSLRSYHINEPIGHPMFRSWLWGPLVLLLIWKGKQRKRWLLVLAITLLVALGASWKLFGLELPMPHYLFLFHWLPYFDRLWFPYRILGFSFLVISLWAGLQVSRFPSASRVVLLCLFGVGIGLGENYYWKALPIPSKQSHPPSAVSCIRDKAIELPIGFVRQTLMWQTIHEQQTFGGMGENGLIFLPKKYRQRLQNPFVLFLAKASFDPDTQQVYAHPDKQRILDLGFHYLVLDREIIEMELLLTQEHGKQRSEMVFDVQRRFNQELGQPSCVGGSLVVWSLLGDENSKVGEEQFEYLWNKASISAYEQKLIEMNRVPK